MKNPESIQELVRAHFERHYKDVTPHLSSYEKQLNINFELKFIDQVLAVHPIPKNALILDVASGFGSLLLAFKKKGYQHASGIDCDVDCLKIAKMRGAKVVRAFGEKLPFPDQRIDVITSVTTLEHVENVQKVLNEIYRVLKKKGVVIMDVPNYDSGWEGHYKINLRIPLLPHWFRKIIYKLYGRDVSFYNSLNHLTLRDMRKRLSKQYARVRDLQQERFLRNIKTQKSSIYTLLRLGCACGLKPAILFLYDITVEHMIFLCEK